VDIAKSLYKAIFVRIYYFLRKFISYLTNGEKCDIIYTKDDFRIQSLIDRNSTLKRGFKGKTGLMRQIVNLRR